MSRFRRLHLVTDQRMLLHQTAPEHPESPERIKSILERLGKSPISQNLKIVSPHVLARTNILQVHSEDYLMRFEETCLSGKSYFGHPDNEVSYDTYEAALISASCGILGIDLLESNEAKAVVCLNRPPGHHAEPGLALGFCFLNNVAIAAKYWQRTYGRKKIAIVDFDAHHGNGIEIIFNQDPSVLYVSIHEHPTFSFPGTGYYEDIGDGEGHGYTLNIPLLPGSGDVQVMNAIKDKVTEKIRWFCPDAIIIAAGFDAHELDDMSGLTFTTKIYGILGAIAAKWAQDLCQGRIISILEGGYHLKALSASCERYVGGITLQPRLCTSNAGEKQFL